MIGWSWQWRRSRQGWPVQWSGESSNLLLVRLPLLQHPSTGDRFGPSPVWLMWGWRLQSEGPTWGRIVVLMNCHPHREGLCRGSARVSPHPGDHGGCRSCWCEGWTPLHSYELTNWDYLWLQSLLELIYHRASSNQSIPNTTPNNAELAWYFKNMKCTALIYLSNYFW